MRINEHQASGASGDEGAGQLFNKIISDYFGFIIRSMLMCGANGENIQNELLKYPYFTRFLRFTND